MNDEYYEEELKGESQLPYNNISNQLMSVKHTAKKSKHLSNVSDLIYGAQKIFRSHRK